MMGFERYCAEIVGTRATTPPPDVALRDLSDASDGDPAALSASLQEAAGQLAGGSEGLRGPVTDLLLTMYRRIPVDAGRIEVRGDAELVDFWLERVGFG